ncbi:MAG: prolyl oligopeptidase family serine peptidase [Clostridia bacterium]|nr:prolyl oligopeptidase family serine peptidase [Clostridia bacterium]
MKFTKQDWTDRIGTPDAYAFPRSLTLVKTFTLPGCRGELYHQANGPDTFQRVMMLFPDTGEEKYPAVAVPFYYPEAMFGMDPFTGETLPRFAGIEIMLHLVQRGYAVASADAYHLTYRKSDRERDDFRRWHEAAEALLQDHPHWTGIGKLTADTMLLVDALAADTRVNADRIGIAGHSLGGKMAFYTGCLDDRIRVILASDFGFGWEQTNWKDLWYWGDKVKLLQEEGMDHSSLLSCAAPKPMCLLAGQYDDMSSYEMMCRAEGYENCPAHLQIIHHAAGHRPTPEALEAGYAFLDRFLK